MGTMTTQEAIQKSIENGYHGDLDTLVNLPAYAKNQIWMDPRFWKCLGKAMRWNLSASRCKSGCGCEEGTGVASHDGQCIFEAQQPEDVFYWHRLIDALASGKTIGQFFEEL